MHKFFLLSLLVAVSMVDGYSVYPVATYYNYVPRYPFLARQPSSSLGPFFGYFPNMFGTRCPTPFTPAAASLTSYGSTAGIYGASASPSGTIAPTGITTSSNTAATYIITAYDSSKTISVTCTFATGGVIELTAASSGTITPTLTSVVTGTKYAVTGGYAVVKLTPAGTAAWAPSCAWTTA